MRRLTILVLAMLALPTAASAYSVRLDTARCTKLTPPQVIALGPDWSALAAYVQRCLVPGPDGRTALTVDVVRLDRAYAAHLFNAHPDQKVPDPVLRDMSGRVVGTLPEGFPVDPPGVLRVTFADWSGGRPLRIELFEAGRSAVSPERLPPMRWYPGANSYR